LPSKALGMAGSLATRTNHLPNHSIDEQRKLRKYYRNWDFEEEPAAVAAVQ
jgi:hypothetical protein